MGLVENSDFQKYDTSVVCGGGDDLQKPNNAFLTGSPILSGQPTEKRKSQDELLEGRYSTCFYREKRRLLSTVYIYWERVQPVASEYGWRSQ